MSHLATVELEAAVEHVRQAPADVGTVELLVRRPAVGEREVLDEATLDPVAGLVGDSWKQRGSRHTDDGSAELDAQLNVMSWRMIAALASDPPTQALAGDQLFLDLDLGVAHLPAGTRLALGSAVIEVTAKPHSGCAKFAQRSASRPPGS